MKISGIKYRSSDSSEFDSIRELIREKSVESINFDFQGYEHQYWVSNDREKSINQRVQKSIPILGHEESLQNIFRICCGLSNEQIGTKKGFKSFESAIISGKQKDRVGPLFSRLYTDIEAVLRNIYSSTTLRTGVIERFSAAAELSVKIFGDLNDKSALVIGESSFFKEVKAALKERDIGFVESLRNNKIRDEELSAYDILVVKEETTDKINQIYELVPKMTRSNESSFLILDFGSAANSLHELGNIYNVFYTHASSLDSVISRNLKLRSDAIPEAEKIIERRVKEFLKWSESDKWDVSKSIIARSHQMQKVFELIYKVAPSNAIVIISGETGTGKELVAKAIHKSSQRGDKPFIAVNCGAIPENLLESTLFGYVKGAFTGAHEDKKGIFQAADGGVLFLDEIAELPMMLQVKLLRALQDNEITPVGGNRSNKVNVRILAATNKNLMKEVMEGRFREDLFYRLNVVEIVVPPLRERVDDILALANHFLLEHSNRTQKDKFRLSDSAAELLTQYQWPGNVRELQNVIERAAVLSDSSTILPSDLPEGVLENRDRSISVVSEKDMSLEEIEEEHIRLMLRKNRYNYNSVAETLGIGRTTLWRKMKKYGIASVDE